MGAWRIRVTGTQRKEVDADLLMQAVLALAEQLREEERQAAPERLPRDTGTAGSTEAGS